MLKRIFLCIAFTLLALRSVFAQQSDGSEKVWTWSKSCPAGRQLQIEALLQGKPIFQTTATICQMNREAIPPEDPQQVLEFFFRSPGAIFTVDRDKAGKEQLEGNIWEAGGEVGGLLLGVSVVGKENILLNSIHFAEAEKASQSEFGGGLSIRSTPIPMKP